jgi:SAM-dependent methyltransferase
VDLPNRVDGILASWKNGSLSAHVALMELLLLVKDVERVAKTIEGRTDVETTGGYCGLLRVLAENRDGAERVVRIARTLERQPMEPGPDAVRSTQSLFDQVLCESEEASVALYSLGSATTLAEATAEVVALLDGWRCVDPNKDLLDIGSGIGRFEEALAPRVRSIRGIDVSAAMVEAARRRTSRFPNVRFDVSEGRDLAMMRDGTFDLVLAIDSMPYIVEAGGALVDAIFQEIARVLRPGGELVICGFSYRNDCDRDRAEVDRQSRLNGFEVLVDGALVFKLWNARVFRLRSSRRSGSAGRA